MQYSTEDIRKFSAEEVINGAGNEDRELDPVPGEEPDYKEYSGYTDIDILFRFRDMISCSDASMDRINTKLNRNAIEYEGEPLVCPTCKRHLDLINNNGNYCKFCGQSIRRSKTTGECLIDLRKKNNMNQTALAKALGVSSTRMCLLEKNKKQLSITEIKTLTNCFKCSVNELFGQNRPRIKTETQHVTYSDYDTASFEPKETIKVQDDNGYESEYIYTCPFCGEEVDLSISEALTMGLDFYEVAKERSTGNDGHFCKHCGQALIRPVTADRKKELKNFSFWIKKVAK